MNAALTTPRLLTHGERLDRVRELLAERYARGELSGERYRAHLHELKRSFQGAQSDG